MRNNSDRKALWRRKVWNGQEGSGRPSDIININNFILSGVIWPKCANHAHVDILADMLVLRNQKSIEPNSTRVHAAAL